MLLVVLAPLVLSSCAKLITEKVVAPAVGNIQQQTDIQLVCDGAPSYLLMVDSMLAGNPEEEALLSIASQAYVGYVAALGNCENSTNRLPINADKARLYGTRLLEEKIHYLSEPKKIDDALAGADKDDVGDLFWGSFGIFTWIEQQGGSPAAMAELVIVEKTMARILELDEGFQGGAAHLFFAGYYSIKPAFLGGGPDKALPHFERALELGERKFLLTQVTFAKTYARLIFDEDLHNTLLKEVLDFPIDSAPEFGLSNRIAQKHAKALLEEDFFE